VAARTGLVETELLAWTRIADLMGVEGMEPEDAALLQAAGVQTLEELRGGDAATLTEELKRVSEAQQLARALPDVETVARWVHQAATLATRISY
jgi:hypothetical protein